ncbi:MAG: protein kinase domain-containing protein [Planctomycetota bacterium]
MKDGDDAILDRIFGELVTKITNGESVDLQQILPERADLRSEIISIYDLAKTVAVRRAPSLPRIPGYVVLRELGRGGMGAVFLAKQERPARFVALKTASAHVLSSARTKERFDREVQSAAKLKHPNIITIHEVGEFDGVPYFTMEHVEGTSLGDALDCLRNNNIKSSELTGQRLGSVVIGEMDQHAQISKEWDRSWPETSARICLEVSEALQHAHENGIIHRDVKPSNIMLRKDGRALLFDFGLALNVDDERITLTGDFLGSACYTAPEQANRRAKDANARTDIYSTGATLYELLTLEQPFHGNTTEEILRKVLLQDPEPPRSLNSKIPRDLETICMIAMEKDPARRYASAAELAADLRRFLTFEPIRARPIGNVTKTFRFVRRNRALSASMALGVLLFIGTPTVLWIQQRNANVDIARQARKAIDIQKYQESLFTSVDPDKMGRNVKVADVLDKAALDLKTAFPNDPEINVSIRCSIAASYKSLGLFKEAESVLREALELADAKLPPFSRDRSRVLNYLGNTLERLDRTKESVETLERGLRETINDAAESDSIYLSLLNNLANANHNAGNVAESTRISLELIRIRKAKLGLNHKDTVLSIVNYASALTETGNHAQAVEALAEVDEICSRKSNNLGININSVYRMTKARILFASGEGQKALNILNENYEELLKVRGERHHVTLVAKADLGLQYHLLGNSEKATQILTDTLAMRTEVSGPLHMDTLSLINSLGIILTQSNKSEEAEELFRDSIAKAAGHFPASHESLLTLQHNLALTLGNMARFGDAEEVLRNVIEMRTKSLGAVASTTLISKQLLVQCLVMQQEFIEAETLQKEAMEAARQHESSHNAAEYEYLYASILYKLDRIDEAETYFKSALARRLVAANDPEDYVLKGSRAALEKIYDKTGRPELKELLIPKETK